jgi:hypothetical protein
MRRRQAEAAKTGGDLSSAFSILFDLALERVLRGEDLLLGSLRHQLDEMLPKLEPLERSKLAVLYGIASWYEQGSALATTVPALRELIEEQDRHAALLCCLVLEDALVDGLYDFDPPLAIMVDVDGDTDQYLGELRVMAAASDGSNAVLRARLRVAVADAALLVDASSEEVDQAYCDVLEDALAGRFLRARGLVTSRAAYAFAIRGDTRRAENLWRQSILVSSEDRFYGDARNAMRASVRLAGDSGQFPSTGLDAVVSALPNRRRLLAGAHDPSLSAFEAAHNDKLVDAVGETRRYLWESRLAGHLQRDGLVGTRLGDRGSCSSACPRGRL